MSLPWASAAAVSRGHRQTLEGCLQIVCCTYYYPVRSWKCPKLHALQPSAWNLRGSNRHGCAAVLGPSWAVFGPFWGRLRPCWDDIWSTWGRFQPFSAGTNENPINNQGVPACFARDIQSTPLKSQDAAYVRAYVLK